MPEVPDNYEVPRLIPSLHSASLEDQAAGEVICEPSHGVPEISSCGGRLPRFFDMVSSRPRLKSADGAF